MSSEPAEGAPLRSILGFRLVTRDLPRLRRFYQETLGFAADGPEQAIPSGELALLGVPGAGRRQALQLGEQLVALDQFDITGRPYPDHGDAASLWFQHLALVVADMAEAYRRVAAYKPISEAGPQHLPQSSGGVHAFKFRDPDGHPLELLQFPAGSRPPAWQGRAAVAGQIGLGIDHSAISVTDADASRLFYRSLGLEPGDRTSNHGPEQQQPRQPCRGRGVGGADAASIGDAAFGAAGLSCPAWRGRPAFAGERRRGDAHRVAGCPGGAAA